MKHLLITTLVLASFNTFAIDKVDLQTKKDVCAQIKDIVPTESGDGKGISMKECLKGEFEVSDETNEVKEITVYLSTVEDMTTVCKGFVINFDEISTDWPEASCEIQ